MKNKILFYLSVLLVLIWMVIIYSFSETPSKKSNDGSKGILREVISFVCPDKTDSEVEILTIKFNKPFRKFAHASVYFVLANFVNSVVCCLKKDKIYFCNLITLIICFIYALSDEWHQTFVLNRTGQFSDVLIDFTGALIGCLVFDFIYRFVKKMGKCEKCSVA